MTNEKQASNAMWPKIVTMGMMILTTAVIVNSMIDYKTQPLHDEIANLKVANANKPEVRVISTKAMAEYFIREDYDTKTELEYIDILKILLDQSNIIGISDTSLQFKSTKYELKLNDIETLRKSLAELGIENPRITNEAEYEKRENLQKEIFSQLTQQLRVQ